MRPGVLACALAVASTCQAEQSHEMITVDGLYVGGAFGEATAQDLCSDIPAVTGTTSLRCGKREDYGKLLIGVDLHPLFAIEAGLHHLGEYKFALSDGVNTLAGTSKGAALSLRALANLRADRFFAFAAAGLNRWDVKAEAKRTTDDVTVYHARESGYSITWGGGVGLDITKWLTVRAEYERFSNIGNGATTGRGNINAMSLGLIARF